MNMNRETFEEELDKVLAARSRKRAADIDAAVCQTDTDRHHAGKAGEEYATLHEAFVERVFAKAQVLDSDVKVVSYESQDRGTTRGRPLIWCRGLTIYIVRRGVRFEFDASLESLTLSSEVVEAGDSTELTAKDWSPLRPGHSLMLWGREYHTDDDGPPDLTLLAVETCRTVALALFAAKIDYFIARRDWPKGVQPFECIVAGAIQAKRNRKEAARMAEWKAEEAEQNDDKPEAAASASAE